jgi:hypothetical protein
MKNKSVLLLLLFVSFLATGCSILPGINLNADTITPSGNIISEERAVSGFTAIDIRTFGQVNLAQGETESLRIEGSDNLVELVKTRVQNGVLTIEMQEDINVLNVNFEDLLTFTITVKDLTGVSISGLADVRIPTLFTSKLEINVSGAGQFHLDQLQAESVQINLSGLGNIELAGEVSREAIEISGSGQVSAADLKCQNADITIPGLGGATVWVTEQLSGNISGGGNVSYYGNPETDLETSGIGQFKSLGNK